jgi:hypothetical protein
MTKSFFPNFYNLSIEQFALLFGEPEKRILFPFFNGKIKRFKTLFFFAFILRILLDCPNRLSAKIATLLFAKMSQNFSIFFLCRQYLLWVILGPESV